MEGCVDSIVDLHKGSESICRKFVSVLTDKAKNRCTGYSQALEAWKHGFINIHGTLDSQRKIKPEKIQSEYGVIIESKEHLFAFIFALENYYALILRMLAYKRLNESILSIDSIGDLLNSRYFLEKGILNYDCDDIYNAFQGDESFSHVLKSLIERFHNLPAIYGDYDALKMIFERLFPREVRHSMGEFYTPDWLAEYVISTLTSEDKEASSRTYLDPTCGSGTFIFSAVSRFYEKNPGVLNNIFGIDINPLSVLAAKTNYLLICDNDFLEEHSPLIIPIFTADIADPARYMNLSGELFDSNSVAYNFHVSDRSISVPVRSYDYEEYRLLFLTCLVGEDRNLPADLASVRTQLQGLDVSAIRRFMSQFAPLCLPEADYVVGNPPWVNWEYLPRDYKERTAKVWQYYDLFDYKGMNSIFVKEDISGLITYVSADKFLKRGGKLGFVIKETLFKSSKHGAGFRKFYLSNAKVELNPFRVDDLTGFKPFPELNNRTAIVFIKKGEKVEYPTDYICWESRKKKTFDNYSKLENVISQFDFTRLKALPVDRADPTSGWISLHTDTLAHLDSYLGTSAYKARTGVFSGGANGLYWIQLIGKVDGRVIVSNLTEKAKIKFRKIRKAIEPDHVYPLLVGSELNFWASGYSRYIICPHTARSKMYPIDLEQLKKTPHLLSYFKTFRKELEERKGFTSFDKAIHDQYFYALQRIGEYTFSPYKVAWRYICKRFTVAVIEDADDDILGKKTIIPNEKIIYVGLSNRDEAFYLCGILSSTPMRELVESFTVSIQIGPSTIDKLQISEFDPENEYHMAISKACRKGHKSTCKDRYLEEVDALVTELYSK